MKAVPNWTPLFPGIKETAAKRLAGPVLRLLNQFSDQDLARVLQVTERYIVRYPPHLAQIQRLRDLFESGHPALGLVRRTLTELHPNCQKALINFALNGIWGQGQRQREAFYDKFCLHPPFLMVISPTMRCNLKCLGCYAGEYPRGLDPMSFETLDRVISEAKQMGIYMFVITGGEPFMRPDMLDLYEKHNDAVFQIYTNGTCIFDKTVERLQKLGNAAPCISLEGGEAETDFRRGKGIYAKVMDTMDRLHAAKLLFGFSGTVTRLNADIFTGDEFYDCMEEKGCLIGWLFMFVPVGQDATVDLMPTAEQRDATRRKVLEVRRKRPIFIADFWNDGCLTGGCMSAGSLYLHLNFRGDLEPCVFMHFAQDNIHDIYARGGHLWDVLQSPLFTTIRDVNRRDPNKLRPCPVVDHNEWLEEALAKVGAGNYRWTHPGAEDIIGRLALDVRKRAAEYAPLAEAAWDSPDYDAFHEDSPAFWLKPKTQ